MREYTLSFLALKVNIEEMSNNTFMVKVNHVETTLVDYIRATFCQKWRDENRKCAQWTEKPQTRLAVWLRVTIITPRHCLWFVCIYECVSHTLKSKSASVKFLCRAGDKYWAVVRMMLQNGEHTHTQLLAVKVMCSVQLEYLTHENTVRCASNLSGTSYLLVRSLMTFQSRGKILSFIRFLNTHKIFNKNSWREKRKEAFESIWILPWIEFLSPTVSVDLIYITRHKGRSWPPPDDCKVFSLEAALRTSVSRTLSSSLLWKFSIRCWKWMSVIWRRRDRRQDTYSPCQ